MCCFRKQTHIARVASAFLWQESKEVLQEQATHVWSEAGCTLILPLGRLVQAGLSAQGRNKGETEDLRLMGMYSFMWITKKKKWFCCSLQKDAAEFSL